jgi:hypothetical protein
MTKGSARLGTGRLSLARNRIVKIIRAADGTATPHDGRYIVRWHPHVRHGTLAVTSTADIEQATRFTLREILETRRSISRVEPYRPDGEPNRPLAAITIEITEVER